MSCILYAADKEAAKQIDINDLYEKDKKRNQNLISGFNKILNRIHTRIRLTSKTKWSDRHIFYMVPEILFGQPYYDKAHCIAFLTTQLQNNHFHTRYIHPNTLFISWQHFIPTFVRDEIKNKTGIVMDSLGQIQNDPTAAAAAAAEATESDKKKKYKSIDKYKPTRQFVYNPELFDQIERHVQFDQD